MRRPEQICADLYLTAYMVDCVNQISSIDGNLKMQKILFLHEFRGIQDGLKANHYKYFRYSYGPYSKDLANDLSRMEELGFVTKGSRRLTKRGNTFIQYFLPEVRRRLGLALDFATEICHRYGRFSGPQLVNRVYALEVPVYDLNGEPRLVREISAFTDIFDPAHDTTTREISSLDEETLKQMREEFSISDELLDPSNLGFKKAVNEALEGAFA